MSSDPVVAITTLLLAAFVLDRLASAIMFLFSRPPQDLPTPTELARRDWNHKLLYFFVASAGALAILGLTPVRVLPALGLLPSQGVPARGWVDACLTFIVLVGGADHISSLVKPRDGAGGGETTGAPIQVHGTLTINDPAAVANDAPRVQNG